MHCPIFIQIQPKTILPSLFDELKCLSGKYLKRSVSRGTVLDVDLAGELSAILHSSEK